MRVILTVMAAWCVMVQGWGFKTKGDGTTYSFETLSQLDGSGVTAEMVDGRKVYTMSASDTIAAGDHFKAVDGGTVRMMGGVTLRIEGSADFESEEGYTFVDASEGGTAVGIVLNDVTSSVWTNCTFEGVGLKLTSCKAGNLTKCTFTKNNGTIGQSALVLTSDGGVFGIDRCTFTDNPKAAIASAANMFCNMEIKGCEFKNNGTLNGNTPQLNLTVADAVVVENCTITGNPAHTMVGAIGISNFYGRQGNNISIIGCTISDNRYGIGTVGPMSITIKDNTLTDNKYEENPMNGGSGISLYDPYQLTTAMISGNRIEGSLWGVTVIGCKDVNLGRTDVGTDDENYNAGGNTFKDNGNGGELYDLYNNSANTVYAQNNTWNVSSQTQEEIETVIVHKADDATLGEVIYWPAANGASGVESVTEKRKTSNIKLQTSDIFDLQGVRHSQPQRGINIVGGRKFVGQ